METPKKSEDSLNSLLNICGYGPWQRKVFVIFFILNITGVWQNFLITFIAPNIDFQCIPPNDGSLIHRSSSAKNISIEIDQCSFFAASDDPLQPRSNGSSQKTTIPCKQWSYNHTTVSHSIVSEWNLVCDRAWIVPLAKSVYMFGFMFSVIIFGQISDCIGRFSTIMICYGVASLSGLLTVFTTSYLMFLILRFFLAFGRAGMTTIGFVLMMELTAKKYRERVCITIQLGWTTGLVTLPAVAWFIRDWFWLQMATILPMTLFFFMYWMVPESPHWLMTQGKMVELRKTIMRATKVNGRHESLYSDQIQTILESLEVEPKRTKRIMLLDIYRFRRMRYRALNKFYLWAANSFLYYNLSYNTNDLAGDPYLNFFISGALEFPAFLWVLYAVAKFGRRNILVSSMISAGTACAFLSASPQDMPAVTTVFAMIGKFFTAASFRVLYIYCPEFFPTVIRNVTLGSCSMCARTGSILAPFAKEFGKATHPYVPNILCGILGISSGLLAILLPETKGEALPDTLEDGENFGLKPPLQIRKPLEPLQREQVFLTNIRKCNSPEELNGLC